MKITGVRPKPENKSEDMRYKFHIMKSFVEKVNGEISYCGKFFSADSPEYYERDQIDISDNRVCGKCARWFKHHTAWEGLN